MNTKKVCAVILAALLTVSVTACGKDKKKDKSKSKAESSATSSSKEESSKKDESSTSSDTKKEQESVKVYYGWGSSEDEEKYTTEIFCPEGAEFDETTLEDYEEDGSVITAMIIDEVNEYKAVSATHWHRDAYNNDPLNYPIIAQLYFDGEVDAETAAENSGCSQKVTPLGFKWNGYDVIMIETSYTFKDYGETKEVFAGVEYDLDYWKTEEGTGKVQDLTTKSLFGFDITSLGLDDLTKDQCAWIIGEIFGVDSGVANPYAVEEEKTEAVVNVDKTALVGEWIDLTSDWEDTYIFNADGTGTYISGPEYDFTYKVSGDTLTLIYDEDDTEEYKATVDGSKLVLVDKQFGYEQSFTKSTNGTETPTEAEIEESAGTDEPDPKSEIIGTWKESETGIDETFTFNADGTGNYSCLSDDGTYECKFTFDFLRSDYVNIYFDDNSEGGFQFEINGNKMTVRNEYVDGLTYTRQ